MSRVHVFIKHSNRPLRITFIKNKLHCDNRFTKPLLFCTKACHIHFNRLVVVAALKVKSEPVCYYYIDGDVLYNFHLQQTNMYIVFDHHTTSTSCLHKYVLPCLLLIVKSCILKYCSLKARNGRVS